MSIKINEEIQESLYDKGYEDGFNTCVKMIIDHLYEKIILTEHALIGNKK